MRALIIEDEPLLAWMIEDILQDIGVKTVDHASSEAQAIAVAKQNCPDVLIVDHHLNGGSGVAAVQAICAEGSIPTIFITADAHGVRRSLPDATILEKPFGAETLSSTLQKLFLDC